MSYSLEEKVRLFAILSRLGVLILQFLTNLLIPDHDAGTFQKPMDVESPNYLFDDTVKLVFGGLTNWDAQYFLHIAEYGYTYENALAFFPLFPIVIRQLSYYLLSILTYVINLVSDINDLISFHSTLIVTSAIFNNLLFIKTSLVLFKLSLLVLKNEKLAYISSILFCINPASIFFSACYSESLYCFLAFYAMVKIEEKHSIVSYLVMGMTGAVRSNGIVNLGFFIYKHTKVIYLGQNAFFYTLVFSFGIVLFLLPFLVFQMYCFAMFCLQSKYYVPTYIYDYGKSKDFIFPGNHSVWCKQLIPFAYSYVQKHYWNVGFLEYYEIKQIPNFLLATPMVYIILRGTLNFVRHYKHLILFLGFVNGESGKELPISTFPYVVQAFALTIFSVLMINVQVTTRLLASSSPVFYWYCANAMALSVQETVEGDVLKKLRKKSEGFYESSDNKKSKWKTFLISTTFRGYPFFIKWYFILYVFVGTLMFSNHLPWT